MIPSQEELARLESLSRPIHPAANLFPLDAENLDELAADIKENGQHVPIEILDGKIVDGRRRSLACRLAGVEPVVRHVSPDDAVQYVLSLNLHRRHLTTSQRALIAAEIATLKDGERPSSFDEGARREDAAAMLSVSTATLDRAKAVLASGDDDLIAAVKSKEMPVSRAAEIVKERAKPKPHRTNNGGGDQWHTPPKYLEAAREVLGTIDLDPASSQEANALVKASRIHTADDDGLSQKWSGRVWLNPPFGKELCAAFVEKLVDDFSNGSVSEALLLVNNATETAWFQTAIRASKAVCFLETRIQFLKPGGEPGGQPLQGQSVVYFGSDPGKFAETFGKFGQVLGRIGGAK